MSIDQDWTDVWPTAATFNPSVVPLPIRQGFVDVSPYWTSNVLRMLRCACCLIWVHINNTVEWSREWRYHTWQIQQHRVAESSELPPPHPQTHKETLCCYQESVSVSSTVAVVDSWSGLPYGRCVCQSFVVDGQTASTQMRNVINTSRYQSPLAITSWPDPHCEIRALARYLPRWVCISSCTVKHDFFCGNFSDWAAGLYLAN